MIKVFIYDSLMNIRTLRSLIGGEAEIISIEPAFATGVVLVDAERHSSFYSNRKQLTRFPIMLFKKDTGRKDNPPHTVFGACITFDIPDVLAALDSYYSCSKSSLGENKKTDMFLRKEGKMRTIRFKTQNDFLNHRFEVVEGVRAFYYLGNVEHPTVQSKIKDLGHKCIGSVWRSFFSTF